MGSGPNDARGIGVALEALKVRAQIRSMLVAQRRIFFERFVDDAFELSREPGIETEGSDWRVIEDAVENFGGAVAAECRAAGGHFIEDDAKAEKIAARIEIAAAGLFGRHIGDGAESGAGAGEIGGVERVVVVFTGFGGGEFGGGGGGFGGWFGGSRIEKFFLVGRGGAKCSVVFFV